MDRTDDLPVKNTFYPMTGLASGPAFPDRKLQPDRIDIVIAPCMIKGEILKELRDVRRTHIPAMDDRIDAFSRNGFQHLLRIKCGIMGIGKDRDLHFSVNKAVFQQGPDSDQAVLRLDLFPFAV